MASELATGTDVPQPAKKPTENLLEHAKEVAKVPKKLAGDATRWAMDLSIPPPEGTHPAWPEYARKGSNLSIKLEPGAYNAKTLVENTIATFYPTLDDSNLTPNQILAKENIISLFTQVKESNKRFGTRHLNKFLRLFDQFFFCGALVNGGRPRVVAIVWEASQWTKRFVPIFCQPIKPGGYTRVHHIMGYGPLADINIAGSTLYKELQHLDKFLKTTVHEIVHAYLYMFMCRCEPCFRDSFNTLGTRGHGPSFLMLLDCIDQTLRSWNVGLGGLSQWALSDEILGDEPSGDEPSGRWHVDEFTALRQGEERIIDAELVPYVNLPDSLKREMEAAYGLPPPPTGEGTSAPNQAAAAVKNTKPTKRKRDQVIMEKLQPIEWRALDQQVFVVIPECGGTVITEALLDKQRSTVQDLLAEAAAEAVAKTDKDKKLWAKLKLRWARLINKEAAGKGG
ncbi:hypothetical protein F4802DRAFT_136582 [Xylaria palmicola]|nr:hypothetical protein F4802DRAFT_136582 [Xylaria palmicola]